MSHEMISENSGADSEANRRHELLVLLILAAVQFTTIVDFMIVMPLGPQLMRTFNIGPDKFSLIVSSYTFAAGIAGLVASAVVDRFARRATFMILYFGFLLGTLLCALAPTYPLLVFARVVTGAFGGILGGITMTIIGDVFPEQRRGRAIGSLMTGFALASVAGVPLGLYLGTTFGWQVPFIALVIGGFPALVLTPFVMPPLNAHVNKAHSHPLRSLVETFSYANHLNAFALIIALTIGSMTVFPYISAYFVANVGMAEEQLPFIYVAGGAFTLMGSRLIGRLTDQVGKLIVYRFIAPISAILLIAITHLPHVSVWVAVVLFGAMMVSNVGRMIAAMAIITSSVAPQRRGGFLSANSSVQHIANGFAAHLGGMIIAETADNRLENFGVVGWIAATATFVSLWLAGRVRSIDQHPPTATSMSLAAAAEASVDASEPMLDFADKI